MFVRGLEGAVVTFDGDPAAPVLHFSARDALGGGTRRAAPDGGLPAVGLPHLRPALHDDPPPRIRGRRRRPDRRGGGGRVGLLGRGRRRRRRRRRAASGSRTGSSPRAIPRRTTGTARRAKATARLDARRAEAWLCRWCGAIHRDESESCLNLTCGRPGPLVRVYLVLEEKGFRCLGCGARGGSQGGRTSEPIRPLRASSVADVHILAQEMISAAGSDEERRLLIFADNRQDAAFQAGWMRDHARRYRLRYLLVEALASSSRDGGPVSVGDLHADVVRRLRSDRDLARAVAPEAFDGGADEAFGRLSDTLLSRFIRIQILRELATAFAQRDGLERWGQLRVVYAGLEPDSDERGRRLPPSSGWRPRRWQTESRASSTSGDGGACCTTPTSRSSGSGGRRARRRCSAGSSRSASPRSAPRASSSRRPAATRTRTCGPSSRRRGAPARSTSSASGASRTRRPQPRASGSWFASSASSPRSGSSAETTRPLSGKLRRASGRREQDRTPSSERAVRLLGLRSRPRAARPRAARARRRTAPEPSSRPNRPRTTTTSRSCRGRSRW